MITDASPSEGSDPDRSQVSPPDRIDAARPPAANRPSGEEGAERSAEGAPGPGAEPPPPTLGGLLRAAVADRLPPVLRGGRIDPGRRGAWAVALVAVVVAAVAVVLFLRSQSETAVAPVTVSTPHAAATSSSSPGQRVTVDVAGKVHDPGLVRLPAGSRVADAVQAAGGATSPKAIGRLNLARKVTDGEQILVGLEPAAGAGQPSGASAGVSLNQATASQLEELPDVGPVLAQRIVDYRTEHGSFTRVDQLRQVSGIGEKTYADLKDKVRL